MGAVQEAREALACQLDVLRQAKEPVDPHEMAVFVEQMLAQLGDDTLLMDATAKGDIFALATYIKSARAEIADIRPQDISEEHVPIATDELDAIVESTEMATNVIFEAVETIETLTSKMDGELANEVSGLVTSVYEACSFQDITGQRITKVIGALKNIEEKVDALVEVFGIESTPDDAATRRKERDAARHARSSRPDEHLMNGPQSTEAAISQDDIDALMGFD